MQSAYLWDIFHLKLKKLLVLTVLTWFLILGKIEEGGQDGDHCWSQASSSTITHKIYLILLRGSKAFH